MSDVLQHQFAGADWVRASLKVEPSPLGAEVADILGYVCRGVYHLRGVGDVDWTDPFVIEVHANDTLATYDGQALTELVVLAHDRLVRVEMRPHYEVVECDDGEAQVVNARPEFGDEPSDNGVVQPVLCILFHKRYNRDGDRLSQRHPTIEDAIMRLRTATQAGGGAS